MDKSIASEILQFVDSVNKNEKLNEYGISLRLSEKLFNTVINNKQIYIRNALTIYYLIRNSPYRDFLLQYLGYNQDMQFNIDQFKQNYGNGFLMSKKSEQNITPSNFPIENLQSELSMIKELIQKLPIQPIDTNVKSNHIIEQTKIEMDNFLGLLSDPKNFDGIDIKDILSLFSESIREIKKKLE